jgi:hypothetical protein
MPVPFFSILTPEMTYIGKNMANDPAVQTLHHGIGECRDKACLVSTAIVTTVTTATVITATTAAVCNHFHIPISAPPPPVC